MQVSVISATYNRAQLLDNALTSYSKQTLPKHEWEYLVCDDMSVDDTKDIVEKWKKKGLPLRYFTAAELGHPKVPGQWRDGCKLRNSVSTFAFGEVLIATHPEIIIPPNALEVMYKTTISQTDKAWVTAMPYWMPNSAMITGWEDNVFHLRNMDGFYDPSWPTPVHSPGAPDYRNQNQENRTTWESEVFFAMKMEDWRWIGGFREFEVWGSVDMDFLARRGAMKIRTVITKGSPVPSGNLMVFHQYHESKRDMDAAMKELKGSSYTPEGSRKMGGLYTVYNHGHRERATDGKLGGVLGDHVARYKFAAIYSHDKVVLDCPCGTGYGREIVTNAKEYIGVDVDAESVLSAKKKRYPHSRWLISDMRATTVDGGCVDLLLCFEGMEHIDHQKKFVDEMYRVLRPGGTFIISTPQRGATGGTPWDRYIISADELYSLFSNDKWCKLDWFWQLNYADPAPPRQGTPPKNAAIMILGGTRK